jgi:hypothetical protein
VSANVRVFLRLEAESAVARSTSTIIQHYCTGYSSTTVEQAGGGSLCAI